MYIYIYICIYIYIYIFIYIYIYIYIYILDVDIDVIFQLSMLFHIYKYKRVDCTHIYFCLFLLCFSILVIPYLLFSFCLNSRVYRSRSISFPLFVLINN